MSAANTSKGPRLLLGSVLALASSCGGEATSERQVAAGAATDGEHGWGEQINAEVRRRAPWPVDLLLSFARDYRGPDLVFGEIQSADLLRLEIGGDPSARDQLRWLFEWVDLHFDWREPLRADQQPFAGVASLRNGLAYSFPQFLLADSSGRPYATAPRLEIRGGWAWARTVAHLQDVRVRRDEHLDHAMLLDGVERAREIAVGLDVLEEQLVTAFYQPEMRAIVDLDADGSAGLRARYAELLQWGDARAAIMDLQWLLSDCMSSSGPGDRAERDPVRMLADVDFIALHEASRRIAAAHRNNAFVQQFANAIDACSSFGHVPIEQTRRRLDAAMNAAGSSRMRDPIQRLQALIDFLEGLRGK